MRNDTLNRVQHGGSFGLIFRNRHYNICIRSGAFGIHVASSDSGLYSCLHKVTCLCHASRGAASMRPCKTPGIWGYNVGPVYGFGSGFTSSWFRAPCRVGMTPFKHCRLSTIPCRNNLLFAKRNNIQEITGHDGGY